MAGVLEQDVAAVQVDIQKFETQINNVEIKIASIERLSGDDPARAELPTLWQERAALRQKEVALRQEKAALRQEKAALRQEKVLLLSKEDAERQASGAAAGPSGPNPNVDLSPSFCQRLLEGAPAEPPSLDQLAAFLSQQPTAPVPLPADVLADVPVQARSRFCAAYGTLARAFGESIAPSKSAMVSPDASEHMTLLVENIHIVGPLLALDEAAWPDGLDLAVERNKGDATSLMTLKSAGGASLRPDGVLRDQDGLRMLAKWEDKAIGHSIGDALNDIQAKTAVWTPLYYGNIKYLPCFVAVGSWIQFAAVTPIQQVVRVSPRLDMKEPLHRVKALFHCIQFYKLLRAQRGCYPDRVLPLCKDLVAATPVPAAQENIKRTLYFCSHSAVVRKRIEPWPLMELVAGVSFADISGLYRDTAKYQGLVHAVEGPSLVEGKYTVTLAPIGRQGQHERISSEEDVRCMAHGLLHGLAAIHNAGLVHRDLRLENTACTHTTPRRWFLLDLECCALPDQHAASLHTASVPGVLVDGCYTRASDIAMLGLLLDAHNALVTSKDGREFMEAACLPAKEQQQSTQQLLGFQWLRCCGLHCREAGAQAWEAMG